MTPPDEDPIAKLKRIAKEIRAREQAPWLDVYAEFVDARRNRLSYFDYPQDARHPPRDPHRLLKGLLSDANPD